MQDARCKMQNASARIISLDCSIVVAVGSKLEFGRVCWLFSCG